MTARFESDAFGEVAIPGDRLWGAQTQRAIAVFGTDGPRLPQRVIRAFGLQKAAAARANGALGTLDEARAALIVTAADDLARGEYADQFPLPVWQTGSGTQTNMTANEVIANCANLAAGSGLGTRSPVHPNDHVNRSQSSNDSFPTVMHIAAVLATHELLVPAARQFAATLQDRAEAFAGRVRLGRTHLNDAVPVPMSQGFLAARRVVDRAIGRISRAADDLLELPQGGTAAGSGLNAPVRFDDVFCSELARATGMHFRPSPVKVEAMAGHDALLALSAACDGLAVELTRFLTDLRLLASGPSAGLGELRLPDDGLTSSIMPGKRNATLAEALLQVCHAVAGRHVTVSRAAAAGNFDLNVAKPVLIASLLESIETLADGMTRFSGQCLRGIEADPVRISENIERSMMAATALTPIFGYDRIAALIRRAERHGSTLRDACMNEGLLTADRYDEIVNPERMAKGGLTETIGDTA